MRGRAWGAMSAAALSGAGVAGKENKLANAGGGVKKEEAAALGRVVVHGGGADGEVLAAVSEAAVRALHALLKGELKRFHEVAQAITQAMVDKRGGAWHTIVGKSFGSFVTHEDRNMVYIGYGPVLVLCFKHG